MLLCNWSPVCLLQLAYKIYAHTINRQLKALADRYQLLTMVQEGFRQRQNTKQQIERVFMLMARARRRK